MIFRTGATTAALVIGLAVVGAVMGPQWDPTPLDQHVVPATSSTQIGGVTAASHPVGTYAVRSTETTVVLDGTTVDAMLRVPVGAASGVPGVVFVHGAGTGDGREAFRTTATDLASAGIATLVPSKRLDTYSTRHRDYVAMAGDYLRAVAQLRDVPGVDPHRVGVYGESEGAWIAPVMSSLDPSVAFTVLASAPVVPPRQQAAFAVDNYLHATGVPQGLYRAIPRAVGMALPGGGFEYADFDVEPYLEHMADPVLVLYGTADVSMPIEQGAEEILAGTSSHGNDDVTVRYYDGADHGLRIDEVVVPHVARDIAAWAGSLPSTAGAAPQVAGATPYQRYLAEPVPVPRWLASGDLQLALVIVGASLVGAGVVGLVVVGAVDARRRRERSGLPRVAPRLRLPLVVLAGATVASFVGLVAYVVTVARLALGYARDPWLVQGGWVAVRVLGIAALVGAALLIDRFVEVRGVRRATREGVPTSVGRVGPEPLVTGRAGWAVVAATTLGSAVLLVVLAYWGVFQLGI